MIDTLAYARELEGAGVDRRTAEAHVKAMTAHILPELATKQDLLRLEERLKHELTLRMFGIVLALNSLLFALVKLTS